MKWWITNLVVGMMACLPAMRAGASVADGLGVVSDSLAVAADTLAADTVAPVALSPSEQEVDTATVRPSFYVRRTARLKRDWAALVPNQTVVQFAGSIGAVSVGVGWHYGRGDHWETEILFGYVPRSNGSPHHYTLTGKQRYIPWHIPLSRRSERWVVEPLTAGLFVNTIFGEGFWRHAPSKYTKGYYGFNTKLRYNIFVGQRLRFNIPTRHRRFNKSVSLYYELSTCDLYLVSAIPNSRLKVSDVLSLAVGLRMEVF